MPDVKVTDDLLRGDEDEVHGDKGYTTKARNLSASNRRADRCGASRINGARVKNCRNGSARSIIGYPSCGHGWSIRSG